MLFLIIVFTDDSDTRAQLVAVGLWTDISVRVLKLPGCEQLFVEMLGGGENWILNRSFLKTVRHSVLREMPVVDYVKIHLSVVQVRYGNYVLVFLVPCWLGLLLGWVTTHDILCSFLCCCCLYF